MRRVGHKGADLVRPGNTVESFNAAVDAGVEMIEFDVLRLADGNPEMPVSERSPLVIAHDWHDAASRVPLTLDEALEFFTRAPLDRVEIDCDLKLPGREAELVAALDRHGLIDRAMVSTMEISSLERIGELEPRLRRGWTYPRVTRNWTSKKWARLLVLLGLAHMRRRLPEIVTDEVKRLGVEAIWVFHPIVTPKLIEVTRPLGIEVIAWTVDDLGHMQRLADFGVDGICSNDPRLFAELQPQPASSASGA